MSKSFDFINISSISDSKNADYKKAVRTSSMRGWRRNERMQRVLRHQQHHTEAGSPASSSSSEDTSSAQRAGTPDDELQSSHRDLSLTRVNQSDTLDVTLLDPFHVTAMALPPSHQVLLRHFMTCIDTQINPLGGETYPNSWTYVWLREAISSPLLLTAICCHAATHRSCTFGQPNDVLAFQLRAATIENINRSLANAATLASDETIGAVVMLAADAQVAGSASEINDHVCALMKMARLRGGMQNLGMSGMLASGIKSTIAPFVILKLAADIDAGAITATPDGTAVVVVEEVAESEQSTPTPSQRITELQPLVAESRRLARLLEAAAGANPGGRGPALHVGDSRSSSSSTHLSSASTNSRSNSDTHSLEVQLRFLQARSELEIRLATLYDSWARNDARSAEAGSTVAVADRVAFCVCTALLIFDFRHLRAFSVQAKTIQALLAALVVALREVYERAPTEELQPSALPCLLWAAGMGLSVCESVDEPALHADLVYVFYSAADRMRLTDATRVKECLECSVVWTPDTWTPRLEGVVMGLMPQ